MLVFACLTSPAFAALSIINDLFSPFGFIDMEQFYTHYSGLIDLIVYSMLFIGLSEATIGKRFNSRGGKAVVAAVGISLALGLSISAKKLGFSLASFGPLAASIFIFFVGFIIFIGIKSLQTGAIPAGSLALVFTYFSLRAVSPGFFDWMSSNPSMSWIHSIILLAALVSIYQLIKWAFPFKKKDLESIRDKFRSGETPEVLYREINEETQEKEMIESKVMTELKEVDNDARDTYYFLNRIRKLIRNRPRSPDTGLQVVQILNKIAEIDHQDIAILNQLKNEIQSLSQLDLRRFHALRNRLRSLSPKEQKVIRLEIKSEWKKLGVQKTFAAFESESEMLTRQFEKCINLAREALKQKELKTIDRWMLAGMSLEKRRKALLNRMQKMLRRLDKFTRIEINALKSLKA